MSSVGNEHRCFLTELPAEIRNVIFELALTEDRPLAVCTDDRPQRGQTPRETKVFYALPGSKSDLRAHYDTYGANEDIDLKQFWALWGNKLEKRPAVPALASTCRQFFHEAMPVFFAVNEFILSYAYSNAWTKALFEVTKRLTELDFVQRYKIPRKLTMRFKHIRLHVENCDNESVPSTEDAGRIHVRADFATERLHVTGEGMFEDVCLCKLRDVAVMLQGGDRVEKFVRLFEAKFYGELVNLDRCGGWLPTRCIKCDGKQVETWKDYCMRIGRPHWYYPPEAAITQGEEHEEDQRPANEMRQSDIRDYFARQ